MDQEYKLNQNKSRINKSKTIYGYWQWWLKGSRPRPARQGDQEKARRVRQRGKGQLSFHY